MIVKLDSVADQSSNVSVSDRNVFTNMELSLRYTSVYGFDFDYTLVQYTRETLLLIYEIAKQKMVQELSVRLVITVFYYTTGTKRTNGESRICTISIIIVFFCCM